MRDVSNKTVLTLLVIALVITVAGTLVSVSKLGSLGAEYALLTGSVVDTGTATITVSGAAAISVVDAAIDFGTGYVNASCTNGAASIASDGEAGGSPCWLNTTHVIPTPTDDFHTVENNGTTNLKLNVSLSDASISAVLCAGSQGSDCSGQNTVARLEAKSEEDGDGEAGACIADLLSTYTEVSTGTSKVDLVLCTDLLPADGSDLLEVNFNMTLPLGMAQGAKTATVTYTGLATTA